MRGTGIRPIAHKPSSYHSPITVRFVGAVAAPKDARKKQEGQGVELPHVAETPGKDHGQ